MRFSRFFIDRPIFAAVLSLVIVVGGAPRCFNCPSLSTRSRTTDFVVRAAYPGANPRVIAETVASPLEQQMNGVEDMLYMFSRRRPTADDADDHLRARYDLDNAQVQVRTVWPGAARLPSEVPHRRRHRKIDARLIRSALVSRTSATTCSISRTLPISGEGRAPGFRALAVRRYSLRVSTACGSGGSESNGVAATDHDRVARSVSKRTSGGWCPRAQPARQYDIPALGQRTRSIDDETSSRTSSSARHRTGDHARPRR